MNIKLLILILASEEPPYIDVQKNGQEKTWAKNNDSIVYYYYNKYAKNNYFLNNRYLYMPGIESLDNCGKKTLDAFEYVIKNIEFDYIFRTNISSYINIEKIHNICETFNNSSIYAGYKGIDKITNIPFASGSGILLSKDYIKLLIENKHSLKYSLIDDVMIGDFFKNINVEILNIDKFDFLIPEDGIKLLNDNVLKYPYFRCKSKIYYNNTRDINSRIHDIKAMFTIHNLLHKNNIE